MRPCVQHVGEQLACHDRDDSGDEADVDGARPGTGRFAPVGVLTVHDTDPVAAPSASRRMAARSAY